MYLEYREVKQIQEKDYLFHIPKLFSDIQIFYANWTHLFTLTIS